MINKTPPKGMRDFLSHELALRNQTISKIKQAYLSYGFCEIETPCVDDINLLMSKQGGDNEKLIYKILKRGEKLEKATGELSDLGLRFDLTLPLARYYANNIGSLPPVFKAIQAGPVFRADRPQKGRYRQFVQCDIDTIGEESVFAEIELITATTRALKNVGLDGFTIKINDRRILKELLNFCDIDGEMHEKALISLDKLDKIGVSGVKTEMLGYAPEEKANRFLDVSKEIASSIDSLVACERALGQRVLPYTQSLRQIITAAKAASGAELAFDITLVRGMNYYTGAIFEIFADGIPYALGGGGRYDGLIGRITGADVPACGFSIGFERIVDLLAEKGAGAEKTSCAAIIVPKEQADQTEKIFSAAEKLRSAQNCSVYKKMKNFAYQLKSLSSNGYTKFYLYDNGELKEI